VVALPVYTYRGHGLANKPNKDEYVFIRIAGSKATAAPAESEHGILWVQQYPLFQ
jgi:hypothetical protein